MKYHARIETSEIHCYWNWDKDYITKELLIPFINGQVILLINEDSPKRLINLRSISRITIYRTDFELNNEKEHIAIQIDDASFQKYDCTEKLIQEAKLELTSASTNSLLQKSFAVPKNQAFVVMKFEDKKLDSAYEGVIKPVFKKFGIDVIRVDELEDSGKISDQILELISESRFVLCELTGSRPNCYYETGFAHALGKELILACHTNDKIHFDLSGYRFITWETENEYRKKLTSRLKKLLG
jgi:hypothetical protein